MLKKNIQFPVQYVYLPDSHSFFDKILISERKEYDFSKISAALDVLSKEINQFRLYRRIIVNNMELVYADDVTSKGEVKNGKRWKYELISLRLVISQLSSKLSFKLSEDEKNLLKKIIADVFPREIFSAPARQRQVIDTPGEIKLSNTKNSMKSAVDSLRGFDQALHRGNIKEGLMRFQSVNRIEQIKSKVEKEIIANDLITNNPDMGLNMQSLINALDQKIDVVQVVDIIKNANAGKYSNYPKLTAKSLPKIDGQNIISLDDNISLQVEYKAAQSRLDKLGVSVDLLKYGVVNEQGIMVLDSFGLKEIGVMLSKLRAYVFLNGGSSSSYIDEAKNKSEYADIFPKYEKYFSGMAGLAENKPKGITPAFVNPNGTAGYDFFSLKIRALLIKALNYSTRTGDESDLSSLLGMAQMTSDMTKDDLADALHNYPKNELLKELLDYIGFDLKSIQSGKQNLLGALSIDQNGKYSLFSNSYGLENNTLPMPGGHGMSFAVLKDSYRKLYDQGIRFIYLSNIDNLGALIDDREIAIMALLGKNTGNDFSIKVKSDVKGGILIIDQDDNTNCGDLGVAISKEEVAEYEKSGEKILFNCATGLFNAEWLINNIDNVIDKLPVRISAQNKKAGKYYQAEQVTWEYIGMLSKEEKVIFAVNKYERFIAAKMLMEGLLASRINEIDVDTLPEAYREIAKPMQDGLNNLLANQYGLKLVDGRWVPKTVQEIIRDIRAEIQKETDEKIQKVTNKGGKGTV